MPMSGAVEQETLFSVKTHKKYWKSIMGGGSEASGMYFYLGKGPEKTDGIFNARRYENPNKISRNRRRGIKWQIKDAIGAILLEVWS